MEGNGGDGDLPNNSTPTMEGETFNLLRTLMESVANLTHEVTSIKVQLASNTTHIPLRTHLEQGKPSHQPRASTHRPSHSNTQAIMHPREGLSPPTTRPSFRQHEFFHDV